MEQHRKFSEELEGLCDASAVNAEKGLEWKKEYALRPNPHPPAAGDVSLLPPEAINHARDRGGERQRTDALCKGGLDGDADGGLAIIVIPVEVPAAHHASHKRETDFIHKEDGP
mmetsp:Transcript_10580/g.31202  ORF Transcript_10580/g.31202 Transcript_10580/m.31202 type:complete len:114 (-) Transcript_10580:2303-2644(-)